MMHAAVERRFDPLLDRMRWAVGEGYAVWFVVLGLAAYATLNSDGFLTSKNIENYLGQVPVLVIASIGMLIAVLAGGIDLSVGAVAKLSAVLISGIADGDFGKFVGAVLLAYLIGVTVGRSTRSSSSASGSSRSSSRSGCSRSSRVSSSPTRCAGAGSVPASVVTWAYEAVGPFPYVFLVTLGIVVLTTLWIRNARFALRLIAFGGDREVTRRAGISSTPIVFASMISCSMFAVTAGLALVICLLGSAPRRPATDSNWRRSPPLSWAAPRSPAGAAAYSERSVGRCC